MKYTSLYIQLMAYLTKMLRVHRFRHEVGRVTQKILNKTFKPSSCQQKIPIVVFRWTRLNPRV